MSGKGWGRGFKDLEASVSLSDSPQLDAFGRLRVSEPNTLIDSKLRYGKSTTIWSEVLGANSASTHDANNSCVNMSISNKPAYVVRQTRKRLAYQAGKSQFIEMTGILHPQLGSEKQMGYFQCSTTAPHSPFDGVCFETIDTIMYVSVYKNGTATRVPQSLWNLDTLDGKGKSGIIIDTSKTNIFIIDLQWLGVGRVRFGVNIAGITTYVHEVLNASIQTEVYMRSGSQPLCYRIASTAANSGTLCTMKHICATVQSEGGTQPTGIVAAIDRGISTLTVNTGLTAILGIRLKSTELDAITDVIKTSVVTTSNVAMRWSLCWNPVSVAGAITWIPITGASLEYMLGTAANIVTPLIEIDSGYFSNQAQSETSLSLGNLSLGSTVDGVPDTIFLCAQSLTVNSNVTGGIVARQLV